MTDELLGWFRSVARGDLPDLPDRPWLGKSSGEDQWWHIVAEYLFHIIQRGTATLTWDGSKTLDRKNPDPVWRAECKKAVQAARWLCEMVASQPDEARIAQPFIVQALQAGDALVQMEAALGVGDNEFRHEAFLRHRGDALKRASSVRNAIHPLIVAAMREIRDANATKRRPISFGTAVRIVAGRIKKPHTGKPYSLRWIRQIAKDSGIHW